MHLFFRVVQNTKKKNRYFLGKRLVITSCRPIRRGQVVAENYGPVFTHKKRSDRQYTLQARYWFQCQCLPCRDDWPDYGGMPDMESVLTCCPHCRGPLQSVNSSYARCTVCKKQSPWEAVRRPVHELDTLYQTALRVMDQAQVDKAVQLLSLYVDMMEKLVGDKPVRELHLAQEALRLCLATYGTRYSAADHLAFKMATSNSRCQLSKQP